MFYVLNTSQRLFCLRARGKLRICVELHVPELQCLRFNVNSTVYILHKSLLYLYLPDYLTFTAQIT